MLSASTSQGVAKVRHAVIVSDFAVLEVASGFGEAISYIASSHSDVVFVPSDAQEVCLERLREVAKLHDNMDNPIELNVFSEKHWDKVHEHGSFDGVITFNLLHLIPWEGTSILLEHASQL